MESTEGGGERRTQISTVSSPSPPPFSWHSAYNYHYFPKIKIFICPKKFPIFAHKHNFPAICFWFGLSLSPLSSSIARAPSSSLPLFLSSVKLTSFSIQPWFHFLQPFYSTCSSSPAFFSMSLPLSASASSSASTSSNRGIGLSNTIHSEVAPCLPLPSLPVFFGASDPHLRLSDHPDATYATSTSDLLPHSRKIADLLLATDVSYLWVPQFLFSPFRTSFFS